MFQKYTCAGWGEGTFPTFNDNCILLPPESCFLIGDSDLENLKVSMRKLITFVYPMILRNYLCRKWLAERAILATVNATVDEINNICLDIIPGENIVCFSADSTMDKNEMTRFFT